MCASIQAVSEDLNMQKRGRYVYSQCDSTRLLKQSMLGNATVVPDHEHVVLGDEREAGQSLSRHQKEKKKCGPPNGR